MIALAEMIMRPNDYTPDGNSSSKQGSLNKEGLADLAKAQRVMKKVLSDLRSGDPNGGLLEYGKDWELCGQEVIVNIKI